MPPACRILRVIFVCASALLPESPTPAVDAPSRRAGVALLRGILAAIRKLSRNCANHCQIVDPAQEIAVGKVCFYKCLTVSGSLARLIR
eukprot:m.466566 g.466566  ORF g.466566 m.466566 type:complete len:89 (+) comp25352_c0_seq1:1103-1369(+)